MRQNFCGDVHAGIAFTAEEEVAAYRSMLLIRRFEEKAGQLYALGSVPGPCLLAIGREAAIVGMEMAAGPADLFITGPRCHGHLLARGTDPSRIMAEILRLETGLSGGHGGSVRMQDRERRFFGGHPTGGSQVPLAAGLAFQSRYRDSGAVTLCTLGDSVAETGQTHDTLRLAADLRLPILFIVDNNAQSGTGEFAPRTFSDIGARFGIPGESADGIDVRRVRAAGLKAVGAVRRGQGPMVLELMTYRYRGHAEPQITGRAVRREEQDPIAKARLRIVEERILTEDALSSLEREVREAVNGAVASSRSIPGRAVA